MQKIFFLLTLILTIVIGSNAFAITYYETHESAPKAISYYTEYPSVLDFGAYSGISAKKIKSDDGKTVRYTYDITLGNSNISADADAMIADYLGLLPKYGLKAEGSTKEIAGYDYAFLYTKDNLSIAYYIDIKSGLFIVIISENANDNKQPSTTKGIVNFKKVNEYTSGKFTDVNAKDWFAPNVQKAYELGLVKGASETTFNPSGDITVAETIALACRLHSIYNTGKAEFTQGNIWYQVYVDYAVANGIISNNQFTTYTKAASRAEFAAIMAKSLPADALGAINSVKLGDIPDVKGNEAAYGADVYLLYNAGILTGSDSYGTFSPNSNIIRAEVAVIVSRMADTSLRKIFILAKTGTVTGVKILSPLLAVKTVSAIQLVAIAEPLTARADRAITWKSSNTKVAKVSAQGLVEGLSEGKTTITATTANGKKAECEITVVEKDPVTIVSATPKQNRTEVDVDIAIKNNSAKEIKYIQMQAKGTDSYGKTIGSSKRLQAIGPLNPGQTDIFSWYALWKTGGISKVECTLQSVEFADGTKQTSFGKSTAELFALEILEEANLNKEIPNTLNGTWKAYHASETWLQADSESYETYVFNSAERTMEALSGTTWMGKHFLECSGNECVSTFMVYYSNTNSGKITGFGGHVEDLFLYDNNTILIVNYDSGSGQYNYTILKRA